MIRPHTDSAITATALVQRVKRRQLLRFGFLTATLASAVEILGLFPLFLRVNRVSGLGVKVPVAKKDGVLATWKATNDDPILNIEGRFFLIHGPGAVAAAYRKCTHLGCSVPFNPGEDRFHCPCHGSIY